MYTLQQIKDEYYLELSIGIITRGFEDYLAEHYVQTYDANMNFIGYESK